MVVQYPWDGGPLIINPIYTLYTVLGIVLCIYPLIKSSLEGICHRDSGGTVPLGWGTLNNQPHLHLIYHVVIHWVYIPLLCFESP